MNGRVGVGLLGVFGILFVLGDERRGWIVQSVWDIVLGDERRGWIVGSVLGNCFG